MFFRRFHWLFWLEALEALRSRFFSREHKIIGLEIFFFFFSLQSETLSGAVVSSERNLSPKTALDIERVCYCFSQNTYNVVK